MQGHSNINPAYKGTQAEKIESLLRSRYGQWIPAYELSDLALQYCARINGIRRKLRRSGDRERVENKTEHVRGQVHGSYRIVRTSDVLGVAPAKPKPLKSRDEIVREREEKLRQPAPEFELQP